VLSLGAFAAGEGFEEPFQVSSAVSAREVAAGGEFDLKVTFKLGLGVHLYKHRITFNWQELHGARQQEVILPPGKTIKDPFAGQPGAVTEAYEDSVEVAVRFVATGKAGDTIRIKGTVRYQGCTDEQCYLPQKQAIEHELTTVAAAAPAPPPAAAATTAGAEEAPTPTAVSLSWGDFWLFLGLAFLAGLGLSLTPCVYPMIPITVAIVGGGGQERSKVQAVARSAIYVLGISITYSVLGIFVATLGGAARTALQSPYVLVPVAGVFVVLALSMFDVITIQTPGSVGGLADTLSGKTKGIIGILLLGIVSGLVAGPCVAAPLAGVLIRIAQTGSKLLGFWSMFVLAWGMGVILLVAGSSTGLLPKAGAWMIWVKKLFGFGLLWAAFYFLKPVIGMHYYYLGTVGVLLGGAVFLGCLDSLPPESGFAERAKRMLGLFAIFAAAGFAYAGLCERREVAAWAAGDPEAVEAALESGQPVLLDFYADWCAPCQEMDDKTFSDPRVVTELRRFRTLKINVDKPENRQLISRFGVFGPPTVVLFDSDGTERKDLSFAGFKAPDAVLRLLKQVK